MTALLEDRIALWLADHPGSTSDEVAHGVRARKQSVVALLSLPPFVASASGRRTVYRLGSVVRERPGTAPETDRAFLRRVLSDGAPHNLNEILRRSFAERGCGLTVHSRAHDLRKLGLNVVNWKDGERGAGSWYQLRPLEEVAAVSDSLPSPPPVAASSSGRGTTGGIPPGRGQHDAAAAPERSGQLTLVGGAFTRKAAA